MKKTIALFTVTCLALMLGVAGCGYNTQPNASPSPVVTPGISPAATNPAGQTGYRNTYPNTGMTSPMAGQTGLYDFGNAGLNVQAAQQVAKDLESLPGVQDAACAIMGNTCLAGVQSLNNNTATDPDTIKNEVVQACNRQNLNVNQVLVTTDPTLCRRIAALTGNTFGIGQAGLNQAGRTGQNGMNVQDEFQAIMREMGGTTTTGTTNGVRRSGTVGGTNGGQNISGGNTTVTR
jgi:hypothetical protein